MRRFKWFRDRNYSKKNSESWEVGGTKDSEMKGNIFINQFMPKLTKHHHFINDAYSLHNLLNS